MTEERPVLDKTLNSKTFQEFYYTKKELLDFCRENHISTSGGKLELAERIISFLDTGYVPKLASTANRKTHNSQPQVITTSTLIEDKFVCSQKHRAFFEEHIGKQFSFFVSSQKWLKSNSGKHMVMRLLPIISSWIKKERGVLQLISSLSIIPMFVISLQIIKA